MSWNYLYDRDKWGDWSKHYKTVHSFEDATFNWVPGDEITLYYLDTEYIRPSGKKYGVGLYRYSYELDDYIQVGGQPVDEMTIKPNWEEKLESVVGGYYDDWFATEVSERTLGAPVSELAVSFEDIHELAPGCGIRVTLSNTTTGEVFTTRGLVENGVYYDKSMIAGSKFKVECNNSQVKISEVDSQTTIPAGDYKVFVYGGIYNKSDANFVNIDGNTIVINENGELVAYALIDVPNNGVFDDVPEEDRLPNTIYRTSLDVYTFEGRFALSDEKVAAGWTMDETGVTAIIDPETGETISYSWDDVNDQWDLHKPVGDDPWFKGDADNGDVYACIFDDKHYLDYGEEHDHPDKVMLAMWYKSINEDESTWHIIHNSLAKEADGQLYINNVLLEDNKTSTQLKITVNCTQEEYDAWSLVGLINPETSYYIIDGEYDQVKGNYINLVNKPSIEGVELRSGLTYEDLGLMSKSEIEQLLTGMFIYQGSVDFFSELPISPTNKKGDVYFVLNDSPGDPPPHESGQYAWSGTKWDFIGKMEVDLTTYQKKEDLTLTTEEKRVVPAINELKTTIGDLEELETLDKSSVVNAINEVGKNVRVIDVLADIGEIGTLNATQVKYLLVNSTAGVQQGPTRMIKTGQQDNKFLYSVLREATEEEAKVSTGYRYQYMWVNMDTGEWTGGIKIISCEGGGEAIDIVTELNDLCTHEQVPSAKCMYDICLKTLIQMDKLYDGEGHI